MEVGTNEFKEAYKKLNKEQREAVDTIDGPVMVIAGPGTGKTTILTLRIANILRLTDTPANGILAITYTDAGVKAMRSKLYEIIGNRAHDVRIHTFHSFASSVIAEYPDHFIHISDRKQLTDIEQESIIISILENSKFKKLRPTGRPDAYLYGITKAIEEAKREALTPRDVVKYAKEEIERIKNDEGSISTRGVSKGKFKAEAEEFIEKCERTILFADVYAEYEEKKVKERKMDFSDLIIELLVALRKDELLLRLIQERFLYIHVDEHQDTNDAQNLIIALIAEFFETPNIFIVGDEKQAIYRFQGASVENFLLLQKRWKKMKVISLDTNYRSHQSILDASFSMVENNYEEDEYKDLRVYLNSKSGEEARPIDIVRSENSEGIEKYLVQEIKRISKEEATASIAIIVRRNRDLDKVIRLLESEGISVTSERSIDIFNHPVGRLFFDLIEYLSDPSHTEALDKTVIAGMWNMHFESGVKLIRSLKSGLKIDLKKVLPNLNFIQSKLLDDSPAGFIIHIAEKSGFIELVAKDPSYVHVWRGITALSESLVRENDLKDPGSLLKLMLSYRASAESRPVKVTVGAPDVPIKAMTAHGSKGQEFDYVFIPYATEEAWIGKSRGSSFVLPKKQTGDNDIRDLRRLFYVALTRGKKHVAILVPSEESDGKILSPIRFIEELDKKHTKEIVLKRSDTEIPKIETGLKNENNNRVGNLKFVDLAKHVLLEKGLSVTALNHFIKCPNEFLYQSVLKMPQAPSTSAEKGSAMHEAISKVWKLEDRNNKNIAKKIESTLKEATLEYLENSLLPVLEKEALKKELLEDLPLVALALTKHFSLEGDIFTEHWVEGVFEGNYAEKQIHIPLHGKLDTIVDNEKEVCVFDYKTRQAMSEAAIRGETKNTDGNYFRQLVFYKILLSQSSKWREKKVTPSLVFISPDSKGRCPTITLPVTESDIKKTKEMIQSLIDSVWSGKIGTEKCTAKDCEWCGYRKLLD